MPAVDVSIDIEIKSCPLCGTQPIMRSDCGSHSQNYWVKCPSKDCGISPSATNT